MRENIWLGRHQGQESVSFSARQVTSTPGSRDLLELEAYRGRSQKPALWGGYPHSSLLSETQWLATGCAARVGEQGCRGSFMVTLQPFSPEALTSQVHPHPLNEPDLSSGLLEREMN